MNKLTLEQSLEAYRVHSTPVNLSWKQHYVNETFSNDNILLCDEEERARFRERLTESQITIVPNVKRSVGEVHNLSKLINMICDEKYSNVEKANRSVIFSSHDGTRPVGENGYLSWNGFQLIDLDIKSVDIARELKSLLFNRLKKYNWFLGIVTSSSGKGLHVYTKITISVDDNNVERRKRLFMANFRHKYSFVYIACCNVLNELNAKIEKPIDKATLMDYIDMSMCKPQQGGFIPYDKTAMINSRFFEDFIYVNFDNVEDLGSPDIDWVTHPDLRDVFSRYEYFTPTDPSEETAETLKINAYSKDDPIFDVHQRYHYKHNERWRLANTLVQLYGERDANGYITDIRKPYNYLRRICTLDIKDKELEADCMTARRYNKPIDAWAVNRLNQRHGFSIKMNIENSKDDNFNLYDNIDNVIYRLDNPCIIHESSKVKRFHLKSNEYLGHIRYQILESTEHVSLIDSGAGTGKTEMVKQLVREGKRVMMVLPFTSTIKAKVENVDDWTWSYGNKKVKLDGARGVALTIDKFSRLNLMEIKDAGFDYIFIDESHLMFQSEYRPVMARVIEMIRNSEVPIIMMSGTPVGETVFFPDLTHIIVTKDDVRKKELRVFQADTQFDMMGYLCRRMAYDLTLGRRILFPTNRGTKFTRRVAAGVRYFLQNDPNCAMFRDVTFAYYKKSNNGCKFIDEINKEKSIKNIDVLFCTTYLSVGIDIVDNYDFAIYIDDIWMPQELEQFANRLRERDLFINIFVALHDAEGNQLIEPNPKPIDLRLNEDEIRDVHSMLRLCNGMIERNPVEYKYNSLIQSMIKSNNYIEYNSVENRYYLNEIAYRTTYFERKYREYVQQLYVLIRGMQCYGYTLYGDENRTLAPFQLGAEDMMLFKAALDDEQAKHTQENTEYIEEILDMITEDRLTIYRAVLNGEYEILCGKEYKDDFATRTMYVKSEEMFSKVIPLFMSLAKMFNVDTIKEIFNNCRHKKNGAFNFAAIQRIRILTNILYNFKKERLDEPIKEFLLAVYDFVDTNEQCKKVDVVKFCAEQAVKYAELETREPIKILMSRLTMERLQDQFLALFKCLVNVSRPTKNGLVRLTKIELMYSERDDTKVESMMDKHIDWLIRNMIDGNEPVDMFESFDLSGIEFDTE